MSVMCSHFTTVVLAVFFGCFDSVFRQAVCWNGGLSGLICGMNCLLDWIRVMVYPARTWRNAKALSHLAANIVEAHEGTSGS